MSESAGIEHDSSADLLLQSGPAFEFDKQVAW
jgi:hypothetical protein